MLSKSQMSDRGYGKTQREMGDKKKVLGQVESNSCKSQKVVTYLLLLLFS